MPGYKRSRSVGRRGSRATKKRYVRRTVSFKKRRYAKGGKTSTMSKRVKLMADTISAVPTKTDRMTAVASATIDSHQVYYTDLTDIKSFDVSGGIGPNGIKNNRRLGCVSDIRGWRVTLDIRNRNVTQACIFNFAIVRQQELGVVTNSEFFRDYNDSKDVTFNTALSSQSLTNSPLNPEKFHILMHKRRWIPRATSATSNSYTVGSQQESNYRKIKMWVPFKNPYVFNDDGGDNSPRPIFLMVWCAEPMSVGTVTPIIQFCDYAEEVITFFRDKL